MEEPLGGEGDGDDDEAHDGHHPGGRERERRLLRHGSSLPTAAASDAAGAPCLPLAAAQPLVG